MSDTISATGTSTARLSGASLDCVEVNTGADPRNAVIWLHGLGADGHDFEPLVPMLGMDRLDTARFATRFIFPHAPVRPVTLNGGMAMRAWYDIRGMDVARDQDGAGIAHSAGLVSRLIRRETERGVPESRIVLAGFSQGGAIAAHVGLRHPRQLAGLLILSAYLLYPDRLAAELNPANAATEVFVGHGTLDPMVPVSMGRALARQLRELGMPVTSKEYQMPHAVIPEEIADIAAWLAARLG